ncbi:hypothetical protein QQ045_001436 [Rhodiola kirilowii]
MRFQRHALTICGLLCAINLSLFGEALDSYFSDTSPTPYYEGSEMEVRVNKLASLSTPLPYSYYSLPYCHPANITDTAKNLGEMILGDQNLNSPYTFKMLKAQKCVVVCRVKLNATSAKELKEKMEDGYRVNMSLDDLPLGDPTWVEEETINFYQLGFGLGVIAVYSGPEYANDAFFIYNHLSFVVKYKRDVQRNSTNVAGFTVRPFSAHHRYRGTWNENTRLTTCDPLNGLSAAGGPQEVKETNEIIFTYDVAFEESDVKWENRWEAYVIPNSVELHWFSILSSLAVVLLLSVKVAIIMFQTLHSDISKCKDLGIQEENQYETGWKSVHGDVFRPPTNPDFFCVCIGTGVQVFGMVLGTLLLGTLGVFPPSNQGRLLTAMLLLWALMGLFAGYTCARLHTMFQGTTAWNVIAVRNAVTFPAAICLIFSILNVLLSKMKSSAALPCWTLVKLFALGFFLSIPPVLMGNYIGFRKPAIANPVKTNMIPRQLPNQGLYRDPKSIILIGGILPFGVAYYEVFFILTSVCMHLFYLAYSFQSVSFIILIITCGEMAIILCYNQLCNENYHWWWQSFLAAGSTALYFVLYATYFLLVRMEVTKTMVMILYLGYILIAASAFFLMTGAIGFLACFWFNRVIYSSLKID